MFFGVLLTLFIPNSANGIDRLHDRALLRGVRASRPFVLLLLSIFLFHAIPATASTPANAGWFQTQRIPELTGIFIVVLAVAGAKWLMRRRGLPPLRPLPPVAAIADALGRATESGTPVLYTTGWGGDMGRPTTMASMAILSHVAATAAEYNCPVVFPTHDPVIASVAEDTIRQAALRSGRPEWSSTADVRFVTQSQFGYAAAVEGMIARAKPGAVFLQGTFEGEALILAEAAYQSGAMTIAGTDSTIQLAFFLVACDYTLIGEELFAASAFLSRDQRMIAALLGQDWLKYLILALLITGAALLFTASVNLGPYLAV